MEARTTATHTIGFAPLLRAFDAHGSLPNVKRFVRQAKAFRDFARTLRSRRDVVTDTQLAMALGQCVAIIAYAQLICESASHLDASVDVLADIFQFLVGDLSTTAMMLAALPELDEPARTAIRRIIVIPSPKQAQETSN